MNRKLVLFFLIFFLAGPLLLRAQSEEKTSDLNPFIGLKQTQGFLDHLLKPNNLNISHSYSISCFNIGSRTVSQGLYLSTLNYKFSDPLMMQVKVGYLHHPFGMGGLDSQNSSNGKLFIQRAMFKYQPSKNMTFTIDFQQIPQTMISPYGYYNRYRYHNTDIIFDQ